MSTEGILYTTPESVKVRLAGKVQFESEDGLKHGELPDALLCQLIKDAETEVELELRSRYAVPFRSKSKRTFDGLPDHTKRAIRVVVDLKAVMNILDTDFGRGTHINPEGYTDPNMVRYRNDIRRLLGQDMQGGNETTKRYKFAPPLEDLELAQHNREADDGYRGMIINTDATTHTDPSSYAEGQINNPSKGYQRTRGYGVL